MTSGLKHILVTTDLSEKSFRAFGAVAGLARALGARVTVLHALPETESRPRGSPFVSPVKIPSITDQVELARADLEALRERFGEGIDVTMDATAGRKVRSAILRYVEEHDVDLIALASHGRGGLRRLMMGSVAEAILRHSPVPVLVIPAHPD